MMIKFFKRPPKRNSGGKGGLNEPDYEAVARGIERVKRDRKSGVKELAQKLFERVRIIVQKRIERHRERLQNDLGKGMRVNK